MRRGSLPWLIALIPRIRRACCRWRVQVLQGVEGDLLVVDLLIRAIHWHQVGVDVGAGGQVRRLVAFGMTHMHASGACAAHVRAWHLQSLRLIIRNLLTTTAVVCSRLVAGRSLLLLICIRVALPFIVCGLKLVILEILSFLLVVFCIVGASILLRLLILLSLLLIVVCIFAFLFLGVLDLLASCLSGSTMRRRRLLLLLAAVG